MRFAIIFSLLFALPSAAADTDRFWQIKEQKKDAFAYWRTTNEGKSVLIYNACNKDQLVAKADAEGDKKWTLSSKNDTMTGTINRAGRLTLTLSDGTLFGTGQRIEPVVCGANNLPDKVVYKDVVVSEQTLAVGDDMSEGEKHLEASRNTTLIENRKDTPTPPAIQIPDVPQGNDTLRCTAHALPETDDKPTLNLPLFGANDQIWVGNLLQGKEFKQGRLTPITIPRAGSTITISGVNFSSGAKNSARIPVMTKPVVERAIASLTNQKINGTEADAAYSTYQVYGNDQLAYSLGVDGRYAGDLASKLKIDENSRKNYVVSSFVQTYYHVSMEPPEESYSVFREGDKITDRDGQMGADNPPLYISDVGIGRRIIFLASSDAPGDDLREALNAAGRKPDEPVSAQDEARFKQILARATVSYIVFGGSAISTIGPMASATTAGDIYDKIKKVIADERNAKVTSLSKGMPISYTVSYLTSRAPATIRFATSSNRINCNVLYREYASFNVTLRCVDDVAHVVLISPSGKRFDEYHGSRGNQYIPLDSTIPAGVNEDWILNLVDENHCGPSCLHFELSRTFNGQVTYLNDDGNMVPQTSRGVPGTRMLMMDPPPQVHTGGSGLCQNVSDTKIRLNRFTGDVRLIQK